MKGSAPEWVVIGFGLMMGVSTAALGTNTAFVAGFVIAVVVVGVGVASMADRALHRRRFHRDVDRLVRERRTR